MFLNIFTFYKIQENNKFQKSMHKNNYPKLITMNLKKIYTRSIDI